MRYRGFVGPSAPWQDDEETLFGDFSVEDHIGSFARSLATALQRRADALLAAPYFENVIMEARSQLAEASLRGNIDSARKLLALLEELEFLLAAEGLHLAQATEEDSDV